MTQKQTPISLHHADDILQQDVECLIYPFYQNNTACNKLPINTPTIQHFETVLAYEKFTAKLGELVIIHAPPLGSSPNANIKKFAFIGLGEQAHSQVASLRKAFKSAFEALSKQSLSRVGICIPPSQSNNGEPILDAAIHCFCSTYYTFDQYKTKAKPKAVFSLAVFSSCSAELAAQLPYLLAEQTGMQLAKDLANMPANICTPSYLATQCESLDASFDKISTTIVNEQSLFELNMHSYLAVNKASNYAANMPVMHYKGGHKNQAPIVLIGKGVTFDTGGITKKGALGMEAMIYDMAGAAAVFGLMHTIATLNLPVNVIGILATAENCLDGKAYRPGDVLSTMSGKTVEVISTDAEGRLLLCDAITYAKRFKPASIIDIATLTGAAITSLGHHASGLMANDISLQEKLIAAGESRHDRAWAFPIWEEYMDSLDSTSADLKNTGSNSPGMITAACFLSKFADHVPWAHLDIAGTSFVYGKQKTANGRPLPLLLKFIASYAN